MQLINAMSTPRSIPVLNFSHIKDAFLVFEIKDTFFFGGGGTQTNQFEASAEYELFNIYLFPFQMF